MFVLSQRAKLNLPALQAEARLQTDIKATLKTIAMTIAAYFFSYVPAIVYAVVGNKEKSQADSWFGFFAWYAVSFSSSVNPMIYYVRTSRFRSAFSQFIKDPLGSSDFKEKPSNHKRAATTKQKGGEELSRSVVKKYHGERRNSIMALSSEAFDAHRCVFAAGQSIMDGRGKLNKGDAFYSMSSALSSPNSSNLLPQPQLLMDEHRDLRGQRIKKTMAKKKTCEGKEAVPEGGNKEQSRKTGLQDESRKKRKPSNSSKIHPLEIADPEDTGHRAEEDEKEEEEVLAYCIWEETDTDNSLGKRGIASTLAWA